MAHNVIDIRDKRREQILQEMYELVDEYNQLVIQLDKKFDKVVERLESMVEHGH